MSYSHFYHYMSHISLYFPFNIIHVYHHSTNTTFFSYSLEVIYEFLTLYVPIAYKYVVNHCLPKDNIINILLSNMNVWAILLYVFFYITMHNINYSILHVNEIHKVHHEKLLKNMSPDICDIFFCTKDDIDNKENIDNMILNVFLSAIVLFFIKRVYEKNPNTENIVVIFVILLLFIGMLSSIVIYIDYVDFYYKEELDDFKKKKEKNKENNPIQNKKNHCNWIKLFYYIKKKFVLGVDPYLLYIPKSNPFFRKQSSSFP